MIERTQYYEKSRLFCGPGVSGKFEVSWPETQSVLSPLLGIVVVELTTAAAVCRRPGSGGGRGGSPPRTISTA